MALHRLHTEMKYGGGVIDPDDPQANPITGLDYELRRTANNIASLESRLVDLLDEELIWGPTLEEAKDSAAPGAANDSYILVKNEAKINGYVQLYIEERKHYARICQLAIAADLDTRMVRNATATSNLFFDALQSGLQAAELSPEQKQALMGTLAEKLHVAGAMRELI